MNKKVFWHYFQQTNIFETKFPIFLIYFRYFDLISIFSIFHYIFLDFFYIVYISSYFPIFINIFFCMKIDDNIFFLDISPLRILINSIFKPIEMAVLKGRNETPYVGTLHESDGIKKWVDNIKIYFVSIVRIVQNEKISINFRISLCVINGVKCK